MKFSIVIPSYNGDDLLNQSIPPLLQSIKTTNIKDYEVIIIDQQTNPEVNGQAPRGWRLAEGKDDSPEVKAERAHLNIFTFPHPLGFASAANIGIKKAKGDYILLLNNDCLLYKNTIKNLLAFLKANKNIYFTQPIIKENDKEICGYNVRLNIAKAIPVLYHPKGGWQKTPGVALWASPGVKADKTIFSHPTFFGLSATCLLLRRQTFSGLGYFDESFHSYLEDIDFCFRAAKQNINYALCLTAKATHLHMQTSGKMGSYKAKHDLLNWIRIILKHYPAGYISLHFPSLFIERLRNLSGLIKTYTQKNKPPNV